MADEARTFSRFVRPIYDAIDGKQYKVAIKLAQNKKIASLDIVQVLKAHCLERTGKVDEALAICRTVQSHRPTDETLLNTMALVFRLCGCEHEMLPTYEWACAATAAQPNEELLVSLFVAYARRGDFLKQQQTALKLFKAFGNIKYVCWAALSMVLQVQHAGASSKMLALADKMLLKTMRDTESDDGEALQLLVHILQLQDKHTEALQVFDEFAPRMVDGIANKKKKAEEEEDHCHDHGCSHSHAPKATGRAAEGEGAYDDEIELGPLQAIDRLTLEAALTKRVAEFQRSGNVYHELVNKYNADDWTYLTELIDTRVSANDGDVAQVEKELLAEFDAQATKEGNTHLRGPWLARVHLQSEKLKRLPAGVGKDTKAAEEAAFVEAILAYTDRFYSKTCCFSDLKQYFALCDDAAVISAHTKTSLVAKFEEIGTKAIAGSSALHDETTRKEALNQLHRRLLSLKTLRFLGAYKTASVADLETLVTSLVNEYELNAWLNLGATGGQREVQNTDDLLLLAAHTLIDIYQRNPSTSRQRLIDTAVLLEYGLEKSGYNFQMKLLLSRVYAYLGASEAMMQRHKQLDVKHIQLDSLTFLVFDKLLQLCYHTEARRVCDSVRRLHNSTANDTPEYIARSYRLGVYSKVLDMTSFLREKMQNSHTLAIARGEALQFELQDALTGGPAKLNELATSARFTKAVDDLEKMLQPPVVLSQNQHREVVVQWDSQPLVATSDSFGKEGSALTECDRSATFSSSLQWIKLQLVVPKILMKVLDSTNNDAEAITALATEYDEIVKSLGVANDGVKAKVWSWSVDVVRVAADIAASESASNADELAARVSALVAPLTGVRDSIIGSLPSQSPLSSSSLSNVAALIRDAGLWSGALLCGVSRVVAKKKGSSGKKADDPVASSLRVLIKTVQDTLAAVEAHVKALQVASDVGGKSIVTVSGSSSGDIDAARSKVEGNIAQSYEATQRMVSELLKNASASMRQFHQK